MPLYRDEAITLRSYEFGEADRIVSFFGRRYGKIRVLAKGARKLKSRFAGRLEPFHTVELVVYGKENASLFKLSNIEFVATRKTFSTNLEKFVRACYLVEMTETGLKEHDPNQAAFETLTAAFEWLERESRPQTLDWILRFFDVKFLGDIGYRPTLDRCIKCKQSLSENGPVAFDVDKGGLLCKKCRHTGNALIPLSNGTAKFMEKMASTTFDRVNRFKPSATMLSEIKRSMTAFRDSRLQCRMKTERFFNSTAQSP